MRDELRQVERASAKAGTRCRPPGRAKTYPEQARSRHYCRRGRQPPRQVFRCCTPVPGDSICRLHHTGLRRFRPEDGLPELFELHQNPEDAARWINVYWAKDTEKRHTRPRSISYRVRGRGLVMILPPFSNSLSVKLSALSARGYGRRHHPGVHRHRGEEPG